MRGCLIVCLALPLQVLIVLQVEFLLSFKLRISPLQNFLNRFIYYLLQLRAEQGSDTAI